MFRSHYQKDHAGQHCSDDVLIAHADGELASDEESRVAAHLKQCWECRGRLGELEDTAQKLALLTAEIPFGGAARAAARKAKFLAWRSEFEHKRASAFRSLRPFAALSIPKLAAASAVAMAIVALWFGREPAKPRFFDTWVKAQRYEKALSRTDAVLLQVADVEIVAAERRGHAGRLEVWSDRRGGRYASRWTDKTGELRYAVWQSSPGQAWRYDRSVEQRALPATDDQSQEVSLVEVDAGRVAELEDAVLDRVRKRAWHPLELTEDFARFAATGGCTLDVQRASAADGKHVIRLTARKTSPRASVEFVLELDRDSFRPRLEQASYRVGDRQFLVRLAMAQSEQIPQARIEPVVFAPEPTLFVASLTRTPASSPLLLRPPEPLTMEGPHSAAAELEGMFAEHLSGICSAVSAAAPPSGGSSGGDNVVQKRLQQRITDMASPRTLDDVTQEAVAVTASGLHEAAEIRRLTEWATPEKTAGLDAHSWRLLNRMILDHVARLRPRLSASRGLLEPLLSGDGIPNATSAPHGRDATGEPWAVEAAHVFSHLERVARNVRGLLTNDGRTPENVDTAVSEILEDLPTAEQELGWFQAEWGKALEHGIELASSGK